jgi:hypothetical protein
VGVGAYKAVKVFFAVNYAYRNDQALFPEIGDVPVYGSQGKAGHAGFEFFVHPLGAGVGSG